MNEIPPSGALVGKSVLRLEDPALLRGRARFVDDLPVKPGTLHAAILRSPHAHAEIISIDTGRALQMPGVAAVITRAQVLALTDPFIIGLTTRPWKALQSSPSTSARRRAMTPFRTFRALFPSIR
jgi:2-furoyl-CoA dehydrogenase large subunit